MDQNMQASFSMLVMSIASSAVMDMGLAPNPQNGEVNTDRGMARFNIDLLLMLQQKTQGNLQKEEAEFLENIISDLQLKFVQSQT
ncbi:MAG: DUF1844 domain-containing protein [Bdellovibrionia bacterium]